MSRSEDTFFQEMKGDVETDRDLVYKDLMGFTRKDIKDLSHKKNTNQSINAFYHPFINV